jgi:carbamoyl-phosphate synthase small subunit
MVGYQDLLSDPAYFGKIACMTYPLIGNYGLTDEDYDFKGIHIRGYVVKENNDSPSNFRATRVFSEALEENSVTGLSDVDTREISKIIRDEGTMKAILTSVDTPLEVCLQKLKRKSRYSLYHRLPSGSFSVTRFILVKMICRQFFASDSCGLLHL